MSEKKPQRREFLFTATYALGVVGAGAVAWPLIDQMNPDASVKALASTEVDVSSVTPGKTITVLWRGKPVFIRRRTQDEISEAKSVKMEDLKHPEKDEDRACLLYTSDAADDLTRVDLGGRRIIKKNISTLIKFNIFFFYIIHYNSFKPLVR